jgi:hypothetical protein
MIVARGRMKVVPYDVIPLWNYVIQYLNGQLYAEISIFALSPSILNKITQNFYNILYNIEIMCSQNFRAICKDASEREPFERGQLRNNQNESLVHRPFTYMPITFLSIWVYPDL